MSSSQGGLVNKQGRPCKTYLERKLGTGPQLAYRYKYCINVIVGRGVMYHVCRLSYNFTTVMV